MARAFARHARVMKCFIVFLALLLSFCDSFVIGRPHRPIETDRWIDESVDNQKLMIDQRSAIPEKDLIKKFAVWALDGFFERVAHRSLIHNNIV
jgi:hypothetical protein